jgi:hypothetical protein
LADLAKRRLRSKIGALTEALTGGFTAHHGFLIRMHLNLIDEYAKALDELDARIEEAMAPLRAAWELASHRGPMKALVAVEHSMLVTAWNMLTNGAFYRDPGPDYYTRRVPAKTKARAVRQLESLGYRVTLEPITHTA